MSTWTVHWPGLATAQQPSLETQQAVEMIRGLKARRMFELTDQYAASQLQSDLIPRLEKIAVLNEWIRAKVVQAAALTGEERDAAWNRAQALATEYLQRDPQHPQALLLRVQNALTYYSRGNLIAQEIAAEIQSPDQKAEAIQQFRLAHRLFAQIEQEIEKQIPVARSQARVKGDLTVDQLINLQNNVRYQLSRISLDRAQMYDADDTLNRIDALQQVLSRLDELIRQTNSDVPLWWQAQTSRIQCLRLMDRLDDAISVFRNLPEQELTDELTSDLLTQQILIAAEKGVLADQLLQEVVALPRPDPQLSLAVLHWLMASATHADATAKQQLQQQAANWVTQIEDQHGPYWGRRAEILLVGSIKPKANDANLAQGDFQILVRQADSAFRKGNYSDAARAYAKATEFAQQANRAEDVVYLAVRQAQCYENLKDHAEAAERLTQIANQYSDQPNAAAVHLRGCWNLAKSMTGNAERKSFFVDQLQQQISTWPDAEPSNQARLWLGDHYQNEKQWDQAIRAYLSVQPVSSKSLTAAEQIARAIDGWYSSVRKFERPAVAQLIAGLIGDNFNRNSGSKQPWTEAERLLLLDWLDARLIAGKLDWPTQDGLELLQSATAGIGESQTDWLKAAQVRQIVLQIVQRFSSTDLEPAISSLPTENRLLKELIWLIDETITAPQQQEQYADLTTLICDKALSAPDVGTDLSFWQLRKARSAITNGQAEQVVADLQSLASENPNSLEIQLAYRRVLSEVVDRTDDAIKQWRIMATKVKPGTDPWYESKYNIVRLMIRNEKTEDAIKLVDYLKATSPTWSQSGWAEKFEALLDQT